MRRANERRGGQGGGHGRGAEGEAEAIRIINEALSQNPWYLEWLKTQAWDGKLQLVVGEGGTPFIQIPVEDRR